MSSIKPLQKRSRTQKNEEWEQATADYYIDQVNFQNNEHAELARLDRAAQGLMEDDDYKYVLNPYNSPKQRQYPARLRNYDILNPILNIFMGERTEQPTNPIVTVANKDADNQMKQGLREQMNGVLAQQFINNLNQNNFNTGVPSKEVPSTLDAYKKFVTTYDDDRAIIGQGALDYIRHHQDVDETIQQLFHDWLVFGRCITYKDVYRDDVNYERIHPLEVFPIGNKRHTFIEDYDAVVRATRWSLNDIIDRFRSDPKMTPAFIKYLEEKYDRTGGGVSVDGHRMQSTYNFMFEDGLIDVYHVTWKAFKKVGILTYQNILGQIKEAEVDEDYKLDHANGDIDLKWEWINETREIWRIGDFDYLTGHVLPIQRDELNNSSSGKLSYNGRIFNNYGVISSVIKDGLPYQALYNIFNYRFELTMARNKDKIMTMPLGLIPNKPGWDEDKFMYYAEGTGIAWFDETKPNAGVALQGIKVLDMGLGKFAASMIEFLRYIKSELWENVGMNPQRMADIGTTAGKGTTEQAIYRSSIITAERFRQFDKLLEKDYNGLLDYSKFAWIDGKKGWYITSDKRRAFLNLNGIQHLETDYNIFVKNTTEERMKVQEMKRLALTLGQNGAPGSILARLIDSSNTSQITDLLEKGEAIVQEYEMSQAQQEQEAAQRLQDSVTANDAANREMEKYKIDEDNATKIQVEYIKAESKVSSGREDTTDDDMDVARFREDRINAQTDHDLKSRDLSIKERKLAADERMKAEELRLKEKDIDNKLKVAKENKNKYDK